MPCDFEILQVDAWAKLNSEYLFRDVQVRYARKMVVERQLDESLLWLTSKRGSTKVGLGILVGMPSLVVEAPNMAGPLCSLILPFRVFEHRTVNMSAAGSQVSAETAGSRVLELFNHWQPVPWVSFSFGRDAMQPFTGPDGILCYELVAEAPLALRGLPQVPRPALSTDAADPLVVTLTPDEVNGPEGQFIFYTTDGSFPGDYEGTTAQMWTQAFRVAPGTVVRWAAYKETGVVGQDWRGSHVGYEVIGQVLGGEASAEGSVLGPEGGGIIG